MFFAPQPRLFTAITALGLLLGVSSVKALTVDSLRCDYRDTPFGIDSATPSLSWIPEGQQRGEKVGGYQIWVASSAAALASGGNLWDSGQVAANENAHIMYGGTPLASYQQVFWKVRLWDGNGVPTAWSAPASWTMGVLNPADWTGVWITAPRAAAGYHDNGASTATGNTKWVQVDLGSAQAITSVRLHPTNNRNLNMGGYGFPVRFKIEKSNDSTFASGVTTVTDQTGADYANPGATVAAFSTSGSARYIRVTATTLFSAPNNNVTGGSYLFSLSQIEVISGGQNVASGKAVTAADSLERNSEWSKASLTDGIGLVGSPAVTQSDRFRTDFTVRSGLTRALVNVCGLGQYEMTLNGAKIGADLLTPNWSNYNLTCIYNTYDVTSMLRTGSNAAGLYLGNGFYNCNGGRYSKVNCTFGPRRAIAQIRLEYSDGSVTTIGTDGTWKWLPGPATFSCIYGGEDFDARLDPAGWDSAGFDSTGWLSSKVTSGPAGATLRGASLDGPPVRAFNLFSPVSSQVLSTGITVYDFGQNAAQMPKITVHGPAGATVKLLPSELTNANGTLNQIVAPTYITYTLKGSGSETFSPKFYYMGYRFLQAELRDSAGSVSGTGVAVLDSITSSATHGSAEAIGNFSTSSTLLNNIRTLIDWAQVNNMAPGVMTDCPHREKLGWQEETYFNGYSLRYEHDLMSSFTKQCNDLAEGINSNGDVPSVIPSTFGGWGDVSPEWGSSYVMVPWQQYQFGADVPLLAKHYANIKKWVDFLGTKVSPAGSYLLSYGLGDWYDYGPNGPGNSQDTPQGLTATAIYYQDASVLSQIAQLLGNTADAATYSQLAANIRTAFNTKFLNAPTGTYGVGVFTSGTTSTGSQTSNAMPLALGMVDPANKATVLNAIVTDIAAQGNVVTAGDVGYDYLLRALADNGRSDVFFAMTNRTNKPGYGYILSTGATSLTEAWDASSANSHSQDHFMLGQAIEWYYHDLAGIQSDPAGPGFKKIIIQPALVGDLTWVNATYHSIRGDIVSNWTRGQNGLTMTVTVPAASTATVYVPAANASVVQESGGPASSASGVQYLGMQNNAAMYALSSGTYSFSSVEVAGAPKGLSAVPGANGVQLSWTAPFNATLFNVKRAGVSGGPYTNLANGISATAFTDTTAVFGNTYYYVITAVNGVSESVNSNEASVALTTPAAPSGLAAVAGNGLVALSWNAVAGVSGYRVRRSTTPGGPYGTIAVSATPGTSYMDTGLTNGTTYYYVVTALIFANEGGASAQASATPAFSSTLVSRATGGTSSTNNQGGTNETVSQIFDGSVSTKWYEAAPSGVWAEYQFPNGFAWTITQYRISSANDVPQRDPAAWMLQGSNDGSTWTTVDTESGQSFANRQQTNTYTVASPAPYRFYRLYITANNGGSSYGIQLSELALLSSAADAGDKTAPALTLPAPITVSATSDSGATVSFNATAADAGSGSVVVNSTPASGSLFPIGTTTVQCYATDLAGNTASGSFPVTVNRAYAAPAGLKATVLSESQIRLDWTANATGETNYEVDTSGSGAGLWTVQTNSLPPHTSTDTVNGLAASTNYDFRVKATGTFGSSDYATVSAGTPAGIGDGIPGWWRQQYFGNGLSARGNAALNADPDGDGMTNYQEYLAGTNPTSAASLFHITAIAPGGGGMRVTFASMSGKTYRVDKTSTLKDPNSWVTVQDNVAGTGSNISITDLGVNSAHGCFYRVIVYP